MNALDDGIRHFYAGMLYSLADNPPLVENVLDVPEEIRRAASNAGLSLLVGERASTKACQYAGHFYRRGLTSGRDQVIAANNALIKKLIAQVDRPVLSI